MPKDIVVNLMVAGSRDAAASYAISIAQTFDAHLAGVAFAYEPVLPAIVGGGIPESVIEEQREENDKAAKAAVAQFEVAAKNIKHESRVVPASLAGAADTFGEIARVFDLSIVGQSERDRVGPEELIVEGALFGSGRPVMVVPAEYNGGMRLERVLVCWNGGRNAARASGNAIPFLRRANAVEVVTVGTELAAAAVTSAGDLCRHLERHGINAAVKRIEPGSLKVSAAILDYAAKSGAGMLVMGGYGHSRLREFILGGTTRGVLKAMTVPTLMSH
jgi:nucleotide-binding universal stress UspA family protein